MAIEEVTISSWEEFEETINTTYSDIEQKRKDDISTYLSPLLFRGQSNSNWQLQSTLERYLEDKECKRTISWKDYHSILQSILPSIDSYTSNKYTINDFKMDMTPVPPSYDLMIYLRHHGFPSPLLDWTRSMYIASFFAFNDAKDNVNPAIFTFQEYVNGGKGGIVGNPEIHGLGEYVRNTPRRHHIQQCQYSICYQEIRDENREIKHRVYTSYEGIDFSDEQDNVVKYIIPYSERKKIMNKLDMMNINAFTLFGNEEGLANMLAYREIEKGNL